MALLVHCVLRSGHRVPAARRGPGDPGVELVESDGLAAAVSVVDDDVELTEEDAERHLDVLTSLLQDGPVLPVAFGTVSPDEKALTAEVLEPGAAELTRRLDGVEGYVEARVALVFDEMAALREVMTGDARLRGLADEAHAAGAALDARIALGEAVSSRLTEWRRARSEPLLALLTAAVESVAELEAREPLEQRWAFLVRADRLDELDDAVGEVRATLGAQASVEYVGPLPVYSLPHQAPPEPATGSRGSAWGW